MTLLGSLFFLTEWNKSCGSSSDTAFVAERTRFELPGLFYNKRWIHQQSTVMTWRESLLPFSVGRLRTKLFGRVVRSCLNEFNVKGAIHIQAEEKIPQSDSVAGMF
jgi:hypothetical protein